MREDIFNWLASDCILDDMIWFSSSDNAADEQSNGPTEDAGSDESVY